MEERDIVLKINVSLFPNIIKKYHFLGENQA